MRGGRWTGLALAVVLTASLATSLLVARSIPSALPELDAPEEPVLVEVTATAADHATVATLSGEFAPPEPLLASGLGGTVTRVAVVVGGTLEHGDEVYRVDGIAVRGHASPTVFYRALARGATGDDVTALQLLLTDLLARDVPASGTFDQATEDAVTEYSRQIGLPTPSATFEPAWFVHLPSASVQVSSVMLLLGAPAPPGGESIATGAPTLESARLEAAGSFPDGSYEFVYQGTSVPVGRTSDAWVVETEDAATLLTVPTDGSTPAAVEGRIRLTEPVDALLVPAAAVRTDDSGLTCALRPAAPDAYEPVEIDVVGSDLTGAAQIEPGALREGDPVVLNPASVVEDGFTCR